MSGVSGTGPSNEPAERTGGAVPVERPAHTRRWFLAGGIAVVVGSGAGVGAEYVLNARASHTPPAPPAALIAALAAEDTLIADLDATTGGDYAVRQAVAQARADHAAHKAALAQLIATYGLRNAQASPSRSTAATGTPLTVAQLRAAESDAAAAAARRASALAGVAAPLLASISACEATHVELFG